MWGGDCDPVNDEEGFFHDNQHQWFIISGTGTDPENYTVVMDFWHETAMPHNVICMFPSHKQGVPGSGLCNIEPHFDGSTSDPDDYESCLTAVDIMSGRAPIADSRDPKRTRGGGCKNDGGPLWVTVDLADSPEGITNSSGAGDVPRTVWGRIYQKKQAKSSRRRSRRSRYAQVSAYPTETKSDLVECMALQICTASGGES